MDGETMIRSRASDRHDPEDHLDPLARKIVGFDRAPKCTPRPWNLNSPDETLILGPDRQVVATTLQDEDDYERNYNTRAGDAELIVNAVNSHAPAFAALREAYVALAFAFRRLEVSSRSRDGELCQSFGRVRGKIEAVFKAAGEKL